jgi:ketosteroid isomerase-like protein
LGAIPARRYNHIGIDRASTGHFGDRGRAVGSITRRPALAVARPPVGSTLMLSDRFRATVEGGDIAGASELFREDAVFRSPVVHRPYAGRATVLKVLGAAERVLGLGGHFRYVNQLEDPDARVAVLEFATEVDGRQVEGIDKLTFDEDGRITELTVMLRPASALQAVGARMAEEFARLGLVPSA